jgi:predicted nucleic acid-binding protein
MSAVFLDTSYFIGLIHRQDRYHGRSLKLREELEVNHRALITTDAHLAEFLTYFAGRGSFLRQTAAGLTRAIKESEAIEVALIDDVLFDAALRLYERRLDKEYSMIDCVAMVLCEQGNIREVASADHEFEQEGLTILLG